jgi:hypothetical protein
MGIPARERPSTVLTQPQRKAAKQTVIKRAKAFFFIDGYATTFLSTVKP